MMDQNIRTLQKEIREWHRRNHPTDNQESALLAIGEELGELMRAEVKQEGGIRGTYDEWQKEKYKEAGDVLIGIMNFCEMCNIMPDEAIHCAMLHNTKKFPPDSKNTLLDMHIALSNVIENYRSGIDVSFDLGFMFIEVVHYCDVVGFNPETVLLDRWETISKRDFVANPQTGGREKES